VLCSRRKDVFVDEVFEAIEVLHRISTADIVIEYAEKVALQPASCRVLAEQINDAKEVDLSLVGAHHVVRLESALLTLCDLFDCFGVIVLTHSVDTYEQAVFDDVVVLQKLGVF